MKLYMYSTARQEGHCAPAPQTIAGPAVFGGRYFSPVPGSDGRAHARHIGVVRPRQGLNVTMPS